MQKEIFGLTVNFNIFWFNSFEISHSISLKFSLWTCYALSTRQKKLALMTWLPYRYGLFSQLP